jgi:2-dehydropantoate 2-reductase
LDFVIPLNLLVFGAGAIGTYIGGSLARRGHRITFIEQPEAAAQIQHHGLRLDLSAARPKQSSLPSEPPTFTLEPSTFGCSTSLAEALARGPFDVAIFALKSYDTQAVLDNLQDISDSLPPFLCLQNGVENEAALESVLGARRVIAGTVTSAIGRRLVGDIVLERLRGIGIAAGHPVSRRLEDAMNDAGLNARLYPSAQAMKWSKLLTNLLANATSAILDMTPAEVFAHPGLYRIEIEALREALRVMAAQRYAVVDLPGTPVRLLALGSRLPPSLSRPLMERFAGKGRGGKMPSFHIDLHSGRGKSEVIYLNGAVVRTGAPLGVPAPVNQLLTDTLLNLTSGVLSMGTFRRQPEKLLELYFTTP